MRKFPVRFDIFVRDVEAGDLLEDFLVSAVISIVAVRVFLYLTGYPQLGGSFFHIAHMLYGGLLMMSSIIMLVLFIDREAKQLAVILGGIGFGLFIDELGKFITRDHNYFFQPTIALLYVLFLLIFIIVRAVGVLIPVNREGYAVNGIEVMKELLLHDMDKFEKQKALMYLKKSDQKNPTIIALTELLKKAPTHNPSKPHLIYIARMRIRSIYETLIRQKYFPELIIALFAVQVIWSLSTSYLTVQSEFTFLNLGLFVSLAWSFICVVLGTYFMVVRNRFNAFQFFKYSCLITIFFTQFFLFYQEQLSAIFHLTWNILVYIIIRVLLAEESQLQAAR